MYLLIIVQHEFRDALLVLCRGRCPTNRWILSFRIGIGSTKSFQFDISAYTIRCDSPQFCILKVMVFGIICTVPPSHKCNKERPILCMGSPSFFVHWNDDIGIHIGLSRPSPGPAPSSPGPAPSSATTASATLAASAKWYGRPVTTTFIVTGFIGRGTVWNFRF